MPRIELIDVPLFGPNDPYHFEFDNLPLKNLLRRQNLINLALDNLISQTADAIGTQGTMANRLNQSVNPDGSLKVAAIDETLHSIEAHTDTDDYVRMQKSESDKLALIADGATDVVIEVQLDDAGDDVVTFDSGALRLVPTSTVTFSVTAPNKLKINLGFPVEAAHRHYYDQAPVHAELANPDYINYKVNSIATPYVEDSLRVFINGVRLSSSDSIYVPGALVNDPWTLLRFTPDPENGTFALSAAISEEDIIRVDYDTTFA